MSRGPQFLTGDASPALRPRQAKIILDSLEVMIDIGFHEFEIGRPQPVLVTVEIWLDPATSGSDEPADAWDYDFLRSEVERIAGERRYNLQETLAKAIFDRIAALHGVRGLRVATAKPDIYANARSVGVEIASFAGSAPDRD